MKSDKLEIMFIIVTVLTKFCPVMFAESLFFQDSDSNINNNVQTRHTVLQVIQFATERY